jgi:hypothetical protein
MEIPSAEPVEKCEKATMTCFMNYPTSISAELNHEGTALETRVLVCLHTIKLGISVSFYTKLLGDKVAKLPLGITLGYGYV